MRTYRLNGLKGNNFILIFSVLFFAIQALIAPIYISPPTIPHDFKGYINNAMVIQGLAESHLGGGLKLDYGYLYALLFAAWGKIFGFDYLLLKFPSIIFASLNVIVTFYIIKKIINEDAAKYGSIFFAFSYLTISGSSVEGKGDFFLFFLMVSIYLLLKDKLNYSAIAMGISLSFTIVPSVIIPPLLFYIYQKSKLKNSLRFLLLTILTYGIILIPWYLKAGYEAIFPFLLVQQVPTQGMTALHLLSLTTNHFIYHQPPDTVNPIILRISPMLTVAGYLFISAYALRFRLTDKKIELIRTIFLFFLTWYLTAKFLTNFYILWSLPFVIILFLYKDKINYSEFKLHTTEITGIISILISILLYSWKYRWVYDYTPFDRVLLVISVLLAFFGTYLTFARSRFRLPWSLIVFAGALFNTGQARLLMLFPSAISIFISKSAYYNYLTDEKMLFWASWYVYLFITGVLMVISLLFLLKTVHRNFTDISEHSDELK